MKRTPLSRRTPLRATAALARKTELRARTALKAKTAPRRAGAHRKTPTRPYSFPAAARALIDWRDSDHDGALPVRLCQNCGTAKDPQRHHRRGKGSGGSEHRPHAHCPCDGVTLCGPGGNGCHQWAHAHPREAQARGLIVSQSVDEPGLAGVMRFAATGGGATQWPDCLGNWLDASVMGEEAA